MVTIKAEDEIEKWLTKCSRSWGCPVAYRGTD